MSARTSLKSKMHDYPKRITRLSILQVTPSEPISSHNPLQLVVEEGSAAESNGGGKTGDLDIVGSVDVGQNSVLALRFVSI